MHHFLVTNFHIRKGIRSHLYVTLAVVWDVKRETNQSSYISIISSVFVPLTDLMTNSDICRISLITSYVDVHDPTPLWN